MGVFAVGTVGYMRVYDERGTRGPVQEVELILEGQVVQESQTQDEVITRQVGVSHIYVHPIDAWVVLESLGPSIHSRGLPAPVRRTDGKAAVPGAQVY